MHEMFEVVVDRPWKIHHVPRVAIGHNRRHEQLVGNRHSRALGDPAGADQIDIQRQVMTMLLDRPARHNAHLSQLDRIVDLRPGQFLIPIFRCRTRGCHWSLVLIGHLPGTHYVGHATAQQRPVWSLVLGHWSFDFLFMSCRSSPLKPSPSAALLTTTAGPAAPIPTCNTTRSSKSPAKTASSVSVAATPRGRSSKAHCSS